MIMNLLIDGTFVSERIRVTWICSKYHYWIQLIDIRLNTVAAMLHSLHIFIFSTFLQFVCAVLRGWEGRQF